ncbi:hypothetical protein MHTCC0001_09840 [Flavobacteriaceae bacterium MHTCC 0001]
MTLKPILFKTIIIFITGFLISFMSSKIISGSTTFSGNKPSLDKPEITCSNSNCEGEYHGPEFIDGSDIAHQFSNKMSSVVGNKLKELYEKGEYSKVDFSNIIMSTEGMGSGTVTYKLSIPFITVKEKCDAYTSFDHVGGWNHKPALARRKKELDKALMKGQSLDISDLKTTPEGLQEYWIQWKNKVVQSDCE